MQPGTVVPVSVSRSGVPQGSLVSLSVTHWYPGQPQLAGRWPQAEKCSRHKRRKGFHDFPCAGHHQWQSSGRDKAPQLRVPSDKAEHVGLNTHLPAHLNWRTCTTVNTHSVKTQRFGILCKTSFWKKLIWVLKMITWIIWAMNTGPNTFLFHHWICRKENKQKAVGGNVPELTFIMLIHYRLHLHHISEQPLLLVVIYRYWTTSTFRKTNVVRLIFNVIIFCIVIFLLLLSCHLRTVWGVYKKAAQEFWKQSRKSLLRLSVAK